MTTLEAKEWECTFCGAKNGPGQSNCHSCGLSHSLSAEDRQTMNLTAQIAASGLIGDHVYLLRKYTNCLVGSELVDWLVKNGHFADRDAAVRWGVGLEKQGLMEHVKLQHPFKDQPLFYYLFRKGKGAVSSAAANALSSPSHGSRALAAVPSTSSASSASSSAASSASPPSSNKLNIVICYTIYDKRFVKRVHDALDSDTRAVNVESILHDAKFRETIVGASCDVFVFVLSPRVLSDPIAIDQLNTAVKANKRIVVVSHEKVPAGGVPGSLAKLLPSDPLNPLLFFYEDGPGGKPVDIFDRMIGILLKAVEQHAPAGSTATATASPGKAHRALVVNEREGRRAAPTLAVEAHHPPLAPPKWVADSAYLNCHQCKSFGKKHHCRLCGEMFCNRCLAKFNIPERFAKYEVGPQYVCFKCEDGCLRAEQQTAGDAKDSAALAATPSTSSTASTSVISPPRVFYVPSHWDALSTYKGCGLCQKTKGKGQNCRTCGKLYCDECTTKIDGLPKAFKHGGMGDAIGGAAVCNRCRFFVVAGAKLIPEEAPEAKTAALAITTTAPTSVAASSAPASNDTASASSADAPEANPATAAPTPPAAAIAAAQIALSRTVTRLEEQQFLERAPSQFLLKMATTSCGECGRNFSMFLRRHKCPHCPKPWCQKCLESHMVRLGRSGVLKGQRHLPRQKAAHNLSRAALLRETSGGDDRPPSTSRVGSLQALHAMSPTAASLNGGDIRPLSPNKDRISRQKSSSRNLLASAMGIDLGPVTAPSPKEAASPSQGSLRGTFMKASSGVLRDNTASSASASALKPGAPDPKAKRGSFSIMSSVAKAFTPDPNKKRGSFSVAPAPSPGSAKGAAGGKRNSFSKPSVMQSLASFASVLSGGGGRGDGGSGSGGGGGAEAVGAKSSSTISDGLGAEPDEETGGSRRGSKQLNPQAVTAKDLQLQLDSDPNDTTTDISKTIFKSPFIFEGGDAPTPSASSTSSASASSSAPSASSVSSASEAAVALSSSSVQLPSSSSSSSAPSSDSASAAIADSAPSMAIHVDAAPAPVVSAPTPAPDASSSAASAATDAVPTPAVAVTNTTDTAKFVGSSEAAAAVVTDPATAIDTPAAGTASGDKAMCPDGTVRFELQDRLGEGSYGAVFKALDKTDGGIVAVKILAEVDEESQQALDREIDFLRACHYPFIVDYKGKFAFGEKKAIVMEYCDAGSLCDLMEICEMTLTEEQISAVMRQSLLALDYLHQSGKLHRDIKAANILLSSTGACKLADFGVSAALDHEGRRHTMIGTPHWMAPEVLLADKSANLQNGYNCKADIWSLAITAMELAKGAAPHSDIHPMRAIFQLPHKPPPTLPDPENWSDAFNDFLKVCLMKEIEARPSAGELIATHAFVLARDEQATQKTNAVLSHLVKECLPRIIKFRAMETEAAKAAAEKAARTPQGSFNGEIEDIADWDDFNGGTESPGTGTPGGGHSRSASSSAPRHRKGGGDGGSSPEVDYSTLSFGMGTMIDMRPTDGGVGSGAGSAPSLKKKKEAQKPEAEDEDDGDYGGTLVDMRPTSGSVVEAPQGFDKLKL